MTGLLEYAEKNEPQKCSICKLPAALLDEVNAALRMGVGPTVIRNWLQEEHDIIKVAKHISHHKSQRHHEIEAT